MQKPGNLLENVLNQIENRIKENINADVLADNLGLSSIHLQRLFKFAFKQPIGTYIRSRKLTASLESLFNTNSKMVSIALEYGFEYEETYIRAFKREFGFTPGNARKTRQIVKVTPPLNLLDSKVFQNCIIFKPEIVMLPQLYLIGRKYKIPKSDFINQVQKTGENFWINEMNDIPNMTVPNVYIGVTKTDEMDADNNDYLASFQVKTLKNIPKGFDGHTINSSLCAMFRYIGHHDYNDFNQDRALNMIAAIEKLFNREYSQKYQLMFDTFYIKIDASTVTYDSNFFVVEWLIPVKKVEND